MKNLKTPLAVIAILVAAAGCRKDDIESFQPPVTPQESNVNDISSEAIKTSEWTGNLSWTKIERPTHLVFLTNLKSEISAETAEQGLVRVFASTSEGEKSLPFEIKSNGQKEYWYYQVTEGNVMIAVDVYGSSTNPGTNLLFKTVVLEKQAVENMRANGNSDAQLMELPLGNFTSK